MYNKYMKFAEVYIEHKSYDLDHTFTYLCGSFCVEKGMRVRVPFGHQTLVGFVDNIKDEADEGVMYKEILEVLDEEPLLNDELLSLAKQMSDYYVTPTIACLQTMLPSKLKPKSSFKRAKQETWIVFEEVKELRTQKQLDAQATIQEIQEMHYTEYRKQFKSIGDVLIQEGVVRKELRDASASLGEHTGSDSLFTLSMEQEAALAKIEESKKDVVLLHGATGSGKTEVFLRLAKKVLDKGKQVLFIVPEISLTPLMVERVKERFGDRVAIYHSHLNAQETFEQYQLVKQGKVDIVVGTRSAIFMPFTSIGLIILDEEHDTSYKQDSTPRYYCRDVAVMRAKHHDCKVILSSATPSLESYARAYKGVYELVEMPNRISKNFPMVRIVDMRKAIRENHNPLLSNALLSGIQKRLAQKEQIILLLNRRGYTPVLRCVSCGYVPTCEHCDIALTYHKDEDCLRCHTCDKTYALPNECPECKEKKSWRYVGMGTQRLEEQVKLQFPQANILRMDADTTRNKGTHTSILQAFGNKEADILIGTQMIAKGLDFENVTLVGIVNADGSLARSDYRGVEATFDVLAQACGRSGRGEKFGEVILQTYDTNHYAICCARDHDYQSFFRQEMKYRHLAGYPPYTFLGSIVLVNKDKEVCFKDILKIKNKLETSCKSKVLGPAELIKRKDVFRYRMILKHKSREQVVQDIRIVMKAMKEEGIKSKIEIDLDPMYLED